MTRDEVKEFLPIMQAWTEGKTIQLMTESGWTDVASKEMCFDGESKYYRIKPTSIYRPFADAEECWEEMKKHEPFGWVKDKGNGYYVHIYSVGNPMIKFFPKGGEWNMEDVVDFFTFADGQPFGKLTEEE